MGRDAFVFYRDWIEAIEGIEAEDQLAILLAIAKYALDREDPKLPAHLKLAFKMVKPKIDKDIEKWETTCAKRSAAGKKGAKAANVTKNGKRQQKQQMPANADNCQQKQQDPATPAEYEYEYEYDNVGVNTQNAHPHAHMYEENENDSPEVEEFKAYMRWCIENGYWYANPENVQRLQDFEYARLREKYSKQQILEATQDLEGRQDYKDAHRYASQNAALVAFLRKIKTT